MRSALAAVQGVSHATVALEGHEARVLYDPTKSSIADLVAAVERASESGGGDGVQSYREEIEALCSGDRM